MATIRDVARVAGVSPSTVSRVLNDNVPVEIETRNKVLDSIQKLNYRPNMLAKALKEGKTKTIAFVIPNIENIIYPSLAIAVEVEARAHGYFVLFCDTQENQDREEEYVNRLKKNSVDGFLFATGLADRQSRTILKLNQENYPVVCLMRETGDARDAIVSDNEYGGYLGTSYLIEKGHRNIGVITGRSNIVLYKQRSAGYIKALQEHGISVNPDLIWQGVENGIEHAQTCVTQQLQAGNIPEAIFAQSDPLAFDAMIAISQFGLRVPDDISVLGFDNALYAKNYKLTTVEQPLHEMAKEATRRLIAIIEKRESMHRPPKIFSVRICERGSVKDLNQP
ncbi:MAG: LacI family DNA-binding transcriptional regulator [Candidatus Fimivivens sp.]